MWSFGKQEMEWEVKSLNDQLIEAQTKHGIAMLAEFYGRNSQVITDQLNLQLAKKSSAEFDARPKAEILEKEIASEKTENLELRGKIVDDMEVMTELLENVQIQWQMKCTAHQELMKSLQAQLKVKLTQHSAAESEARSKAELLEKELASEKAETLELRGKVSAMEVELLQGEVEKKTLRQLQASCEAQIATHKVQHTKMFGDLKMSTDMQEHVQLLLKKEKTAHQESKESFQAQLKEQLAQKDSAESQARSKAELLEKELASEKAETLELRGKVSAMENVELLLQKEKTAHQESIQSFQAQLTELRSENGKLMETLKETRTSGFDEVQRTKAYFLAEVDKIRAVYGAKLDEQMVISEKLQTALTARQEELKTERGRQKKEMSSGELEQHKKKNTVQTYRSPGFQENTCVIEEIKVPRRTRLQKTKASSEVQLEAHRKKADSYATSPEKDGGRLEGSREWREAEASLLQQAEELNQMLQEKEKDHLLTEAIIRDESVSLKTRVKILERKIAEKKKRKWY